MSKEILTIYVRPSLEALQEMLPDKKLVEVGSVEVSVAEPIGYVSTGKTKARCKAQEELGNKLVSMGCNACVISEEGGQNKDIPAPTLRHPDAVKTMHIYVMKGTAYKAE